LDVDQDWRRDMQKANSYSLHRLRAGLKPFRLHFFPALNSTSDHAAVLRRRGELFAPAVVLTSRQRAGRGRGANTWFSADGSLTATFVLPVNQTFAPHHLPLAAGLAVRNAVAEISQNEQIQLKWPNDLVFQAHLPAGRDLSGLNRKAQIKKLAGLLCERIDNVDLIGIGVNVNRPSRLPPKNLGEQMIYLQDLCGPRAGALDMNDVLIAIAHHLHTLLVRKSETPFPALLREYDRHHALVGHTVTVRSPQEPEVSGKCQGLDDMGRLLLRDRSRVHRIIAGHVEVG
jgi:BirA family biotin operon repressor/biotin-[acetyl-CoA-carboxylase] ligase